MCKSKITESSYEKHPKVNIKTPTDLIRALEIVESLLSKNSMEFIGSEKELAYLQDSIKRKVWGDFVEFHFLCKSCGEELCLYAETYHGGGGAFEGIEKGRKIYAGHHT